MIRPASSRSSALLSVGLALLVLGACGSSEDGAEEDGAARRPTGGGAAGKAPGAGGAGSAGASGTQGSFGGVDQTGTGGASVVGGAAGAKAGGFGGVGVVGGAGGTGGTGGTSGTGGAGGTGGTGGTGVTGGTGGAGGSAGKGGSAGAGGTGGSSGKGGSAPVGGSAGSGGLVETALRHTYDLTSQTWTKSPLSLLWTGPDAPAPAQVTSAVQLSDVPRLLVFTKAGIMHVQDTSTNTWRAPVALATLFGKSFVVDASFHVPSSLFAFSPNPPTAVSEDLVFNAGNAYWACRYFQNDTIEVQVMEKPLPTPKAGEPDQVADPGVWSVDLYEPEKVKSDYVGSYAVWTFYQSGALWFIDAGPKWTKLEDPRNNRLFAKRAGEPDPATLRAGWFDAATKKAHYLAPGP